MHILVRNIIHNKIIIVSFHFHIKNLAVKFQIESSQLRKIARITCHFTKRPTHRDIYNRTKTFKYRMLS